MRSLRQKLQTRARTEAARGARKRIAKAQRNQRRQERFEAENEAIVTAAEAGELTFAECSVCSASQPNIGTTDHCQTCGAKLDA